jgi:PadR family transcriptional regulator PadR
MSRRPVPHALVSPDDCILDCLTDFRYECIKQLNPKGQTLSSKYYDLYSGLVRFHVLYHASREPVFGLGMIRELNRHGYRLGPGTMYPLLHGMEKRGWLKSSKQRVAERSRRVYVVTRAGQAALKSGQERVRELFQELTEYTNRAAQSQPQRQRTE